ncbi:hypothetical protein SCOR_10055 [Sulfidibacter corallicola]|uniref:Uncharacterized protein n=1 Tax=Sulfidibacter corallicola TaxID=2818388 RepID=A0A8A4TMX6_SULCO|nr:hypothetical protein [Sulfidibacter corallicola]QTD50903.1 hypothetical protein J3U87_00410 [Sulfidibacter corallicola]
MSLFAGGAIGTPSIFLKPRHLNLLHKAIALAAFALSFIIQNAAMDFLRFLPSFFENILTATEDQLYSAKLL